MIALVPIRSSFDRSTSARPALRLVLVAAVLTVGGCGLLQPEESDVFREVEYRVIQDEETTAETPRPQRTQIQYLLANGEIGREEIGVPWSLSMRDSVGDSLAIAASGEWEKEGDEFEVAIVVEGEIVARGEYFPDQNVTIAQAEIPR